MRPRVPQVKSFRANRSRQPICTPSPHLKTAHFNSFSSAEPPPHPVKRACTGNPPVEVAVYLFQVLGSCEKKTEKNQFWNGGSTTFLLDCLPPLVHFNLVHFELQTTFSHLGALQTADAIAFVAF